MANYKSFISRRHLFALSFMTVVYLCVVRHHYLQFFKMLTIDKNIFLTNLWLTRQYCDIQKVHTEKNSTSIFRSINPQINGRNIFKFNLSDYGLEQDVRFNFLTEWTSDPFARESEYLISELFEGQIAHKKANITKNSSDSTFRGDILIVQVDNTVIDGASAVVSNGLIDDYDCPPIDTWFYKIESTKGRLLFAWIPHEFVSLANDAIRANPVECLNWFKNWYPNEYQELAELWNLSTIR